MLPNLCLSCQCHWDTSEWVIAEARKTQMYSMVSMCKIHIAEIEKKISNSIHLPFIWFLLFTIGKCYTEYIADCIHVSLKKFNENMDAIKYITNHDPTIFMTMKWILCISIFEMKLILVRDSLVTTT
jgi:hypothetical protein